MMLRALLLLLVGVVPFVMAASAAAQPKVSGTIVRVDRDGRTLTIEELGVAGQPARRVVTLGPGATVVHVERRPLSAEGTPSGAWPGGFTERPGDVGDLAPGDFVTVVLADGGGRVARTVELVRPGDSAAASPPTAPSPLPPRR